jgi:hypothetical protein
MEVRASMDLNSIRVRACLGLLDLDVRRIKMNVLRHPVEMAVRAWMQPMDLSVNAVPGIVGQSVRPTSMNVLPIRVKVVESVMMQSMDTRVNVHCLDGSVLDVKVSLICARLIRVKMAERVTFNRVIFKRVRRGDIYARVFLEHKVIDAKLLVPPDFVGKPSLLKKVRVVLHYCDISR